MQPIEIDPELLSDFITESGELIVASHLGATGLGRLGRDSGRLRFKNL